MKYALLILVLVYKGVISYNTTKAWFLFPSDFYYTDSFSQHLPASPVFTDDLKDVEKLLNSH